ncbi:ribosome biogenesis GTP-binding protein YihA/YsxC [Candidatus Pantoea carbekii]|uniref:ribosome biogenesis GTP-binding protein YihA/YsxC n=1 Tax=Candidatus Pantoea carbekii TaxID=1235990 RepID=UPI002E108A11|nr:ribosome biogenesis GTP-binding protein YihA/YsxC [Candidatus Pantoea carbekii]
MPLSSLNYYSTQFMLSITNIHYLPVDIGAEIAFAGRSNTGKSSLLNILSNQKKLAYVSKKPGRTRSINYFQVIQGKRIVDLPGYGYAEVAHKIKQNWQSILTKYIQKRKTLKGLVLLMDIRRPLTNLDRKIIKQTTENHIPILLLLSKADKLAVSARNIQIKLVAKAMLEFRGDIDIDILSSIEQVGIDTLRNKLNNWFHK